MSIIEGWMKGNPKQKKFRMGKGAETAELWINRHTGNRVWVWEESPGSWWSSYITYPSENRGEGGRFLAERTTMNEAKRKAIMWMRLNPRG